MYDDMYNHEKYIELYIDDCNKIDDARKIFLESCDRMDKIIKRYGKERVDGLIRDAYEVAESLEDDAIIESIIPYIHGKSYMKTIGQWNVVKHRANI